MTIAETLAQLAAQKGITPSADYKGIEEADDFIFAIQTDKATQTEKAKWIVCADHVKEHSGALNATTTDDTFIRTGTCGGIDLNVKSAPALSPPRAAYSAPCRSTATAVWVTHFRILS